jgi:hypothetical protein
MFSAYNRLMHVCILIYIWQMECAALMSLRASRSRTGECKRESFEDMFCTILFLLQMLQPFQDLNDLEDV